MSVCSPAMCAQAPCEVLQTEAVVPLYLFQVSAHSRPVALQRKPRYSTLAGREGRGCFRDGFRSKTHTDFFFLRGLLEAWVAPSDPQVEVKAHFYELF